MIFSRRIVRVLSVVLGIGGLVGLGLQAPAAAATWQTVTYRAETFQVPAAWPVHDLSAQPSVCPRLDQHAVYLGRAGDASACPAHAVGVTEAMQVQPLDQATQADPELQATTVAGQQARVNSAAQQAISHRIVAAFPQAGVLATISYANDPALARTILAGFTASGAVSPAVRAPMAAPATSSVAADPVLYTGKAFDTCGAPSESAMSAWRSSYGAVGIYIGGANRACPDGNLSAAWVQDEIAAGWNLIPLYVGLQAGCSDFGSRIDPSRAAAQGTGAADTAVSRAQFFGIDAGNPIYFDMESWDTGNSSCSSAVVTFIKAWTTELAKKGYRAGIYGSANGGIAQVIAPLYGQAGTPNLVYFGEWGTGADTRSKYIPSSDWPNHQRIKQYAGNVTETHSGVKMNIDKDYVDGTVVGQPQPAVTSIRPSSAAVGTTVTVSGHAFVPGKTTVKFGGVASRTVNVTGGETLIASVPARSLGSVDVTVSTPGGTSAQSSADRFTYRPLVASAVSPSAGGYWLTTPQGNVYDFNAPWYGSTANKSLPAPIVGMAADPRTGGYWLVSSKGNVYDFGAPWYGSTAKKSLPAPIVGIAADPRTGGYWLVSSKGNVYDFGAPWYGSTASKSLPADIVGMTADPRTGGYWLTSSAGNVYDFNAPWYGSTADRNLPAPVTGVLSSGPGYLLTTSAGNVYDFNAPWYGSPSALG